MGLFKKSVVLICIILFHCSLIQPILARAAAEEHPGDEFDSLSSEEAHDFVEPKGGEQISMDDDLDYFDETFGEDFNNLKEGKVCGSLFKSCIFENLSYFCREHLINQFAF